MKLNQKITAPAIANKTLQYFLQGLVVIAPVVITIYVLVWFFSFVDHILPNIIHAIFNNPEVENKFVTKPGFNFILIILLFIFIGWMSSLFFVGRVVHLFEYLLEHTPVIKFIYTPVKDFFEAFTGNKRKFNKPVLINADATDVWRVGFITEETAIHFGLPEHAVVYVPHSYAVSGITYIIPKERIRLLTDIGAAEAMKFILSGGITEVESEGKSATV